jgi:plasmid maintenance system killer protein
LALVPYLDEKRLELLENKLKQLFSMVINKFVFEYLE